MRNEEQMNAEEMLEVETEDAPAEFENEDDGTREAEYEALAWVYADVRKQSAQGYLVEPSRWEAEGIVPPHLTDEDFEMLVYDVLEHAHIQTAARPEEKKPEFRSASRVVGVPRPIGTSSQRDTAASDGSTGIDEAEPLESEELTFLDPDDKGVSDVDEEYAAPSSADPSFDPDLGFAIPEGYELVELEGELTLVPLEDFELEDDPLACEDIVVLVGKHSYYLYSRDVMTDAYAHWAFLANEDDRVLTFVDCVREESRIYPRPMLASSLSNEPFCMTPEEIDQTWKIISESGEYPDIGQVFASNGEAFFFSENHLSRAYAQSLAEWHAVEREMNL